VRALPAPIPSKKGFRKVATKIKKCVRIPVMKRLPAAREAMEARLRALNRQRVLEEIGEYACDCAGTEADLDSRLEEAGLESLREMYRSTWKAIPEDP